MKPHPDCMVCRGKGVIASFFAESDCHCTVFTSKEWQQKWVEYKKALLLERAKLDKEYKLFE
jgi:hypothetical protein